MRNLLILFLLLISCSGPQTAGGVSEAGNGFIQITCLSADLTPVTNVAIDLNRADYRAGTTSLGMRLITDCDGNTAPISIPAGSWAAFAEQSLIGMGLTYTTATAGDTSKVTVVLTTSGTASVVDSQVQSIEIPGVPRLFELRDGRVPLPAGSYQIDLIRQDGNRSSEPVVVVPNGATTIETNSTRTNIFERNLIETVYNVAFDNSSIGYATENGFVLETNGIRQKFTTANSPIKSNWVRDLYLSNDTIIVATDSGIALFNETDTIHFRAGKELLDDRVIEFLPSSKGVWFVTPAEVGLIHEGKLVLHYPATEFFDSVSVTTLDRLVDGTLVVAGNRGFFRHRNGVWEKDSLFAKHIIPGAVTAVGSSGADILVSSDKSGIYRFANGVWSHDQFVDSTIHCGISTASGMLFGNGAGMIYSEQSGVYSSKKMGTGIILSINRRDDRSLWIGTMGDGVIVIQE